MFLCKFDENGNRINSVDATFSNETEIEKYKNDGFIEINIDDYNKLIGNADKEYIYKDGQIVEKPVYVPTAEEIQEQERAKLDAEYAKLFANKDNEIINAVVLMQDDEYAEQLRQERTALTQEYLTKRSAL